MKISRQLSVPGWDDQAAQKAVRYWRDRGFSSLTVEPGPTIVGKRGSWLGLASLLLFGGYFGNLKPFDLELRKVPGFLRMVPGPGPKSVTVELNQSVPSGVAEWVVAVWRLEIAEVQHLLWGADPISDEVWMRFSQAAWQGFRDWLTVGGRRGRLSDEWECEISDMELKFLFSGGESA